ncbi:hypothetical protein G7Y79_00059g091910 [Physcia stellaris]|nr:hypothetical protein G7Y79_00059g091910 [Physcia stellaris]
MLDSVKAFRLTHFVRIPLSTAGSRPQLDQAYKRVMHDVVATEAGFESEMLVPTALLHVQLGSLSLDTPARVNAAIEHLRQLDVQSIYTQCLQRREKQGPEFGLAEGRSEVRVKIQGLKNYSRHTDLTRCMWLWAPVIDEAKVLPTLCHEVRLSLERAGLWQCLPYQSFRGMRDTYTRIFDSSRIYTNEDNHKPGLRPLLREKKLVKRFDATELYPKYRDFLWAQDVQLEKISLCKMGRKQIERQGEIIGQGYEEVASIPLPGAPSISTGPDMEGDIYLDRPKRRSEKKGHIH